MSEQHESIAHEWFEEVWNQGKAETIDRLFAEDGIVHGLADDQGNALRGPEGFKPFFYSLRRTIPDIQVIVEETISVGDRIAARFIVKGTHLGDGLGFAATGNSIEFRGMSFMRVRDGKFVEAWNNFDLAGLNSQLQASRPAE